MHSVLLIPISRVTITGNGQNGAAGNNNNFGSNCEACSNYYHGNHPINYQKMQAWYCVDLAEIHAVRAVRWQAKQVISNDYQVSKQFFKIKF